MNRNLLNTALCASLVLAMAACTKEPVVQETETRSPIELSVGVGDDAVVTKSVITDGTGKTLSSLAEGTHLFMLMKSEYSALSDASLDYQGSDKTVIKYTTTRGKVGSANKVIFEDDATTVRTRFWDDAHARSSNLSIWALACNGLGYLGGTGTNLDETKNIFYNNTDSYNGNATSTVAANVPWRSTLINARLISWNVPHGASSAQTEETVKNRDLLFSNNIANYASPGTDSRLKFDMTEKKFKSGELVFYHALSKITVNIEMGEGFTGASDFRFPSGKNIKLSYFNIWGQFNAEEGEFVSCNTAHESTNSIWNKTGATPNTSGSGPAYVLEALAIPYLASDTKTVKGSQFSSTGTEIMMELSIDNSNYLISSKQLFDALKNNASNNGLDASAASYAMEAGKNYVFTFTVGKTKIKNITAQVLDWEEVAADEFAPSNARIKLQLEERGTAQTFDVAFYKSEDNKTTDGIDDNYTTWNWKTGYSNMNATYSSTDSHWTTTLFWGSNKDFYHFRALMPAATAVTTDGSGDGDYVTLASAVSYTDVRWGAPMKDDGNNETAGTFKWTYDPVTNGFDNSGHTQIYKAIGPTEDPVKLILFHMMSDLTFTIKTTTGTDKVELCHDNGNSTYSRTRLDLVGFYNGGKVLLGTGLAKTTGSASSAASPVNIPFGSSADNTQYVDQVYTFGAVPQALTAVKLYITAPDNNQYIVDLKDVKATTVATNNIDNPYTATNGKYTIDRWYPGFKYNYTFTLKKTGVDNLTATVVGWETVTADDDTVTIQ